MIARALLALCPVAIWTTASVRAADPPAAPQPVGQASETPCASGSTGSDSCKVLMWPNNHSAQLLLSKQVDITKALERLGEATGQVGGKPSCPGDRQSISTLDAPRNPTIALAGPVLSLTFDVSLDRWACIASASPDTQASYAGQIYASVFPLNVPIVTARPSDPLVLKVSSQPSRVVVYKDFTDFLTPHGATLSLKRWVEGGADANFDINADRIGTKAAGDLTDAMGEIDKLVPKSQALGTLDKSKWSISVTPSIGGADKRSVFLTYTLKADLPPGFKADLPGQIAGQLSGPK